VLQPERIAKSRERVDFAGAGALAVATFTLTFGINRLGAWGLSPVPIASLVICPVAIWLLLRIERRAKSPLLPLHVLSARNTKVVASATFLIGAAWMGNFIITPLLLQSVMGLSAGLTSLATVPRAGSLVLASPLAGRLGVRYGERRMVVFAATALALALGLMAFGAGTTTLAIIVVASSASGLALAHAQPGLLSAMGNSVPEADFGLATSLQQTSNQIGSVVGIGLFTAIAANSTTPGPFVIVYVLAAAFCVISAVIALRMKDSPPVVRHPPAVADDGSEPATLEAVLPGER
jgi:predicted MFS family arabinose efflux permease